MQQDVCPEKLVYKLVQWNVLAHEYTKYNTVDGTTETDVQKKQRWQHISMLFQTFRPDIACVQEITPDFYNFLTREDKGAFSKGYKCHKGWRKEDGCATFIREDSFSAVSEELTCHFKAVGSVERIGLVSKLEAKATGSRLLVCNVHLEGDSKRKEIRQQQVAEICKAANECTSADERILPLILVGDFNENVTRLSGIKSTLLDCGQLTRRGTVPTKWQQERPTYFSKKGTLKTLDYVFGRGVQDMGDITVLPENYRLSLGQRSTTRDMLYDEGVWPSDHYALVYDFSVDTVL